MNGGERREGLKGEREGGREERRDTMEWPESNKSCGRVSVR